MFKITRKRLALAAAAGLLLFGFGVWVLLHPASIWVQPWRAELSNVENNVIFGPYPTEEDFKVLKDKGVTRIVSLLNPAVPYENVLLQQERERAARYGIELLNFPMGSILGHKFGQDYHKNSRAAAQAALDSGGTAYIHCYLGINRAKNVQRYLHTLKPGSTDYAGVGGSVDDVVAQQRAIEAFKAGRNEQALAEFNRMKDRNVQALRLEAWANFRLGRVAQACPLFERVLVEVPGDADATTGLGYCALRANDLPTAETRFSAAMEGPAPDIAAVEGLGYVRFRQARPMEAVELFERVLAANPDNAEARQALDRAKLALAAPATTVVTAEPVQG